MSTYKEIKGFKVQTLSADPVVAGTSWSSGGAMNTARYNVGAAGTQTAALAYGGYAGAPVYGTTSPPSGSTNRTEAYNGSSWTEVADLNQFRNHGISFGTQTAAVLSSGISDYAPGPPYGRTTYTETETWNGSAWTEVNNIPTVLYRIAAFGTSTAGITAAGAKNHPATDNSESYSWDGTNWTDGPNVNTPRSYQMGLGTSTAGMIVGGYIQSPASMVANTEIWNGSAWTEVNDLNTARRSGGASKIGSTSEGIVFGGSTPPTTGKTEVYNGSTWSETADLATARVGMPGGVGIGTSALCFGGDGPPELSATEEFSVSTVADTNLDLGQVYYNSTSNAFKVTKTVLGTGAWASGGTMNTSRKEAMGFGILTANIMAGGNNPSPAVVNNVEQYNGSSWSEITEINTARRNGRGGGTITAGIVFGGVASPGSGTGATETWNGSAWTEVNDMTRPGAQQSFGTAGASSTSALAFGGEPGTTYFAYTEKWDGSSWTEVNNLNTGRQGPAGFGIVTAALCAGGYSPPAPPGNVVANVEKFDGTSWTEVNDINTARGSFAGSGSSTSGLIFGGQAPPGKLAQTEAFDGTSFTEVGDLSKGIYEQGYAPLGASPQSNSAAISAGGKDSNPGTIATTEEWTVPSSVANQTIGSS